MISVDNRKQSGECSVSPAHVPREIMWLYIAASQSPSGPGPIHSHMCKEHPSLPSRDMDTRQMRANSKCLSIVSDDAAWSLSMPLTSHAPNYLIPPSLIPSRRSRLSPTQNPCFTLVRPLKLEAQKLAAARRDTVRYRRRWDRLVSGHSTSKLFLATGLPPQARLTLPQYRSLTRISLSRRRRMDSSPAMQPAGPFISRRLHNTMYHGRLECAPKS